MNQHQNIFCYSRRLALFAFSLIMLSLSYKVSATPTVRDHIENVTKPDYQASMNIWLDGAIGALLSANAVLLNTRREPKLFCLPHNSGLSSADALKILNESIISQKWEGSVPLAFVLLSALQRQYPCK